MAKKGETVALRFLRERAILAMFDIGRTTLWRWRQKQGFPAPRRIGPGTNVWAEDDVRAWIASRPMAGATPEAA